MAQWLLIAGLAIYSILAIAALYFAIKGDVRRAIMAIAGIVIAIWLFDHLSLVVHSRAGIPHWRPDGASSVRTNGGVSRWRLSPSYWRVGISGWVAAVLASLATVANIPGVIAFAIAVDLRL